MSKQTKRHTADLAIFGGPPAFDEPLHVGRPNVGDRARFMERIVDILDRRWLTNEGPYVRELEARLAAYLGVRHCVLVCNGTLGLEIAIRALGLSGEVIVPSFTFVATVHAIQMQGLTPVFADVNPATHTLAPAAVAAAITPRTSAILPVHLWGRPCDVTALAELAQAHDLALLYDAAHAFGCSYKGEMVGSFGDAEVFSFHATKFFNTLEGGAITTNDDRLAERARLLRNFGFVDYDQVVEVGTNAKMNEVSAAMGLTLFEDLDSVIAVNRRNFQCYQRQLAHLPGVCLVAYDEAEKCNYQYVVVSIDKDTTGLSRDEILQLLWAENVLARRYFYPGVHRMEPYRTLYPDAASKLPHTTALAPRLLSLPTGTAVSPEDIAGIAQSIRLALSRPDAVRARLAASPAKPGAA